MDDYDAFFEFDTAATNTEEPDRRRIRFEVPVSQHNTTDDDKTKQNRTIKPHRQLALPQPVPNPLNQYVAKPVSQETERTGVSPTTPTAARNVDQREVWIVGIDYRLGKVVVEHFPPENCSSLPSSGVPQRHTFPCYNDRLLQVKVGTRAFIVPHPDRSVGYQLRLLPSKRDRERKGTIARLVHKGMAIIRCDEGDEPISLLWSSLAKTEVNRFLSFVGAYSGDSMFISGDHTKVIGVRVLFSIIVGTAVAKDAIFDFEGKAENGTGLGSASPSVNIAAAAVTLSPGKLPSGDPNSSAKSSGHPPPVIIDLGIRNLNQGGTKLNKKALTVAVAGVSHSDGQPSACSPTATSQLARPLLPSLSALLGSWEVSGELTAELMVAIGEGASPVTPSSPKSPNHTPSIRCNYLQWTLDNHTPPLVMQESNLSISLWGLLERVKTLAKDGGDISASLSVLDDDGEDVTDSVCNLTVKSESSSADTLTFDLTVLPFEMEGSCCEIRLKISIDYKCRPREASSDVKDEVRVALAEFTSRPFFVRPAFGQQASKDKRKSASSLTTTKTPPTEKAAAEAYMSPYSSDSCSSKFWTRDYLVPTDHLEQGFIDPGRANHLLDPDAANSLLKKASDPMYSSMREREVLLVDEDNDPILQRWVKDSTNTLAHIMDTRAKVRALAWFVSSVMGGVNVTDAAFDECMARLRFGYDTRRRAAGAFKSVGKGKVKQSSNTLKIGSIPIGLCRHRALLFKYLADKNHILCYLVRGVYKEEVEGEKTVESRHSWCIVLTADRSAKACGDMLLVDATHPTPVQEWPQPGYSCPELPAHIAKIQVARAPPTADHATSCFFSASIVDRVPSRQEDVGQGAIAIVHRASFGGLSCAVKVPRCEEDEEDLRKEYAILLDFREAVEATTDPSAEGSCSGGNGIVQCLGWSDGLLLEYVPFSLLGFMNSLLMRRMTLKRKQIKSVLLSLTKALRLVHSKGYVHRDVKTENVLVFPERCGDCIRTGVVCPHCSVVAKLADFADCYTLPKGPGSVSGPAPLVGTVPYCAPELEAEAPFSAAADIWSLGILAAELFLMQLPMPFTGGVTGKFVISPYVSSAVSAAAAGNAKSTEGKIFIPSLDPKITASWGVAFVDGCLKARWQERLSPGQLLEILEAPET